MGLMQNAKHVPSTPNEPSADDTFVVNGGRSSKTALYAILFVVVIAAGIGLAYRLSGGSGASASASAAGQAETKAETPDVSSAPALPSVCRGDLSQASEQNQWYCNGFMPWKQAVDAKLDRLDRRSSDGGMSSGQAWILILLGANSVLCWIVILRRRRKTE